MATGAIVARILSQYNGAGTKAAKRDLITLSKGFDRMATRSVKAFGIAAAAGAAFAVKIGVDSVKAAIADEKSQALLANSLRNTTGANDEVIASIEKYVDQAQRALGITDDELRPAFAKLASITGNVGQAQGLLGIAMDVSAGATVDMATATNAVVKATQGNFKALKNMGVQIDATTTKTKDVDAALKATAKTFAGAASTRAETFEYRMKRVGIAFDEAKESLGIALMPTIESFFQLLTQKVIPAVQKFVDENGDKLVAAFQMALKAILGFAMVVYKTFDFVARNKEVFVTLGILLTSIFAAGKAIAFVTAIQGIIKAFKVMRAAALGAAGATAAATGGISVTAAVAGVAAFAATAGGLYLAVNKVNKEMDKAASKVNGLEFSFDGLDKTTTDFLAKIKNLNVNLKTGATATGKLTAEQLKLVQTEKTLAALRKLGVKPTAETDPIQLEAARLNLLKQQNLEGLRRVEQLLRSAEAQMLVNQNAQKYADILVALTDNKISSDEIGVLAAKWGITAPAVTNYLAALFIVRDQKIDDSEVALLAAAWGISKDAAQKYLDFFKALNDGKLDDKEIAALQAKWNLTYKEVNQYADFIKKLDDFTLSDTEITNLQDQWGLTIDQVLAYTEEIGLPVSYSGTLIEPADAAAAGWNAANDALEAYITQLDTAITQSAAANAAAVAAFVEIQKAIDSAALASAAAAAATAAATAEAAAIKAAADAATLTAAKAAAAATAEAAALKAAADAATLAAAKAAADAATTNADAASVAAIKAAADAAAAAAEVAAAAAAGAAADIAAAAEAIAAAAKAAADAAAQAAADAADAAGAGSNRNVGGATGGTGGAGGRPGDDYEPFALGGIVTSPTLGLLGEAGPEAVIPLNRMGSMGGSITINVQGSVISEGDLVAQIRNAILQGQNSGLSITKSAVSI